MVVDGFMKENGQAPPSPKKDPPQKKNISVRMGGVYIIENKDTNTDYQRVVRVRDQKWEIVEITIGVTFFVWD